jgi:hypothetical protein
LLKGVHASSKEEDRMAKEDPIQALRDLSHKRFIELATELKPKTRQALKSLIDGVIEQLAVLTDAGEDMHHQLDHHSHGSQVKKTK